MRRRHCSDTSTGSYTSYTESVKLPLSSMFFFLLLSFGCISMCQSAACNNPNPNFKLAKKAVMAFQTSLINVTRTLATPILQEFMSVQVSDADERILQPFVQKLLNYITWKGFTANSFVFLHCEMYEAYNQAVEILMAFNELADAIKKTSNPNLVERIQIMLAMYNAFEKDCPYQERNTTYLFMRLGLFECQFTFLAKNWMFTALSDSTNVQHFFYPREGTYNYGDYVAINNEGKNIENMGRKGLAWFGWQFAVSEQFKVLRGCDAANKFPWTKAKQRVRVCDPIALKSRLDGKFILEKDTTGYSIHWLLLSTDVTFPAPFSLSP